MKELAQIFQKVKKKETKEGLETQKHILEWVFNQNIIVT